MNIFCIIYLKQLININVTGVAKSCSLIKCMIPKYKISNTLLKDMILWYIKLLENGQVSLSILMLQWIIGIVFA